jgi:hypothetical protein
MQWIQILWSERWQSERWVAFESIKLQNIYVSHYEMLLRFLVFGISILTFSQDKDPYVRKTAATCVAKLFDINASLCVEQGFLDMLTALLGDANPNVVANAVAALTEIDEASPKGVFAINGSTVQKLLTALNECNNE